jgi:hypothetical protein
MKYLNYFFCKIRVASVIITAAAFLFIGMTAQQASAQNPNIDQWQNTDNQWANGNINQSNSSYIEGESVPYRIIYTVTGPGPHTLSIEWDHRATGGEHAIDYITTWNPNDNPNPCAGVTCGPGTSTFAIPVDPVVTAGFNQVDDGAPGPTGGDDIAQNPGVFTLFGGTITGVGSENGANTYGYNNANPFLAIKTHITVTFTTPGSTTVVLAWGGHIARQEDWGFNHSAGAVSGSDYHMRIYQGTGNQDRSMKADAVIIPAKVIIVKDANPNSAQDFSFTTALDLTNSNCFSPAAGTFLLDDDANGTLSNTCTFSNIISDFGINKTVVEAGTSGWTLTGLGCAEQTPSGVQNSATTTLGATSNIKVDEGEIITCTYTNTLLLAAGATLTGRVLTESGLPIRSAFVTIFDGNTLETQTLRTNSFGYFSFSDLPAGHFYILTVDHAKHYFPNNTQSFTLNEDLTQVTFVSSEGLTRSSIVTGRKGGR